MSSRTRKQQQDLAAQLASLPQGVVGSPDLWLLWTERGIARDIERSSWSPNPGSLGWGYAAKMSEQDLGGNIYNLRIHVGPLPDGFGVIPLDNEEVQHVA